MQNKCNCGSGQGFVPVNGNWDFNMNGDCGCNADHGYNNRNAHKQPGSGCQPGSGRRNHGCQQCERCDDGRNVECCDQNTYIREMDECECKRDYSGSRSACSGKDDCPCETCARNRQRNRSTCSGKDDCQCETCVRNRQRNRNTCCDKDGEYSDRKDYNRSRCDNCGCDKDDDCGYSRNRANCGCKDNDNGSTYARSKKNWGVGMIKGFKQEIDEIFESESALRAGTLFPELHKPMNGYCPYDGNCGTCAQQAAFAAWELRLYLNTHPDDKEALALFRKLCKEAEDENYATTFLKDDCCTSGWSWVKNPWPWEYDCKCGD